MELRGAGEPTERNVFLTRMSASRSPVQQEGVARECLLEEKYVSRMCNIRIFASEGADKEGGARDVGSFCRYTRGGTAAPR